MQDLGVPRQAEMDELRGRIDRLERQVRDLENKLCVEQMLVNWYQLMEINLREF